MSEADKKSDGLRREQTSSRFLYHFQFEFTTFDRRPQRIFHLHESLHGQRAMPTSQMHCIGLNCSISSTLGGQQFLPRKHNRFTCGATATESPIEGQTSNMTPCYVSICPQKVRVGNFF